MALVGILVQLQRVDAEWDEKARRYQEVAQRLQDDSERTAIREAQAQRTKGRTEVSSQLRDGELELQSLQAKAAQIESDLYGGRIRSARELESLRQDGEYHRRRISELEDHVLALMARVEELEQEVSRGRQALGAFEAQWAQSSASLVEEYKGLRARLQELKDERERLRGNVGRVDLSLYDELLRTKGGKALSPLFLSVCQTCRVSLPSNKARMLQAGDTVVTCEGCGRILHPN